MSSINKLSIRGVRAFSPDDEEQTVEFFFPVTIIVGANGCGKTTIIEALKYALSGSLPPGNKSGQAFVHDPRSINHQVVKANVKLRFTNKAGSSMVVIRSMELTQKRTTMTFKQLDGVIRTVDSKTGERVSLSHKCSELDKQIPDFMGVSKAILDYVLFVHQEDSSWPLQEASVLKKRFDDIFDSARYSKALESFRKTKKELQSKVKDIKVDVATFKSHKHAAGGFRREIEEQNTILAQVDEEIKSADDDTKEAISEREKSLKVLRSKESLDGELYQKQNELDNGKKSVAKQRSMLEEDFTTKLSIQYLKDQLRNFDKEVKTKKERLEELKNECKEIDADIEALRNKEMELNGKKGKYEAEKEAHDNRLKERLKQMEKLAQSYSVELQQATMTQLSQLDASLTMSQASLGGGAGSQATTLSLSKDDMDGFFNSLEKKEEEFKEALQRHKSSYRSQDNELSAALTDLYGQKSAIENELKKLQSESEQIASDLKELSKASGLRTVKKEQVKDAKDAAKRNQAELEKLTKDDNRDQINAEIRSCGEKIDRLKEDIESKMSVRAGLQQSATLGNKIAILKENHKKELGALQESIQKEEHTLRSRFNMEVPDHLPDDSEELWTVVDSLSNGVTSKYEKTKKKLSKANDSTTKLRQAISQESATLQSQKQAIAKLKDQKTDLLREDRGVKKTQRIVDEMLEAGYKEMNYSIDKDPQILVESLDEEMKKLEADAPEEVAPEMLAKTLKRLRKLGKKRGGENGQCPCCCRDFKDSNESSVFKTTLEELSNPASSPILKNDSDDVKDYRAFKARLEGWRSTLVSSLKDLNDYLRIGKELEELETTKLPDGHLHQREADLADDERRLKELTEEESNLRSIMELSRRWLDDAKRISEKKEEIQFKEDQLRAETTDSFGDLETVDEQLESIRVQKDQLVETTNKLNKNMTALNQKITAASQKAAQTAERYRQIEEKHAKAQEALEKTKKLNERKQIISKERTSLGEKSTTLASKIKTKESERSRIHSQASDEESKRQETLNSFMNDVKYLQELHQKIEEFGLANRESKLEKLSLDIAKLVESMEEKKQQLATIRPEMEAAKKQVDEQVRQETLLSQNIDLMEYEAQLGEIESEIAEIQKKIDKIEGAEEAQNIYETAVQRIQDNGSKKARLEGRRQTIVEQVRSLNRKLSSTEYRDVDNQHREAVIKQETTTMAVNDLEKYAVALDNALLEFHRRKLDDINRIIKELWLMCYKGEDITNIEIVSGQEKAAAKSYNYRVVMSKGDTKMDMRGRCSAGQRVLASIVIRLALAETFGIQCGCLVLDEPTVNLDYHNKQGLATALSQIIAARAQQSNFQLVLITHDEDFVTMMKSDLSSQTGFSMPEKYFQVHREEAGDGKFYSKIDAIDWDELL